MGYPAVDPVVLHFAGLHPNHNAAHVTFLIFCVQAMKKSLQMFLWVMLAVGLAALVLRVVILYLYGSFFIQNDPFHVVGKFHPQKVSNDGFEVDLVVDCRLGANQEVHIHLDPPLPYTVISDDGMSGIICVNDMPKVAIGDIDLHGRGIQFGDPYLF